MENGHETQTISMDALKSEPVANPANDKPYREEDSPESGFKVSETDRCNGAKTVRLRRKAVKNGVPGRPRRISQIWRVKGAS